MTIIMLFFMSSLYFKHIIYEIWGETGLKNVNSRDYN